MKHYDTVYVPINPGEHLPKTPWILENGHIKTDVKEINNSIILTIEQLREMWMAAQNFGRDCQAYESMKSPSHNGYVDRETYLTSKGITLL